MWELGYKESWMLKNWCFWTVVLEKTLENPLDYKRSNQSILMEISPEYSLAGLMLKLKLQYVGHPMWRMDSLEKNGLIGKYPDAGKDWRQEEKGTTEDEMVDGITDSVEMSLSILWELVMSREARHAAVHESRRVWHNWATKLNWVNVMVFIGPVLVVVVTLRREIKSLPLRLSAADPVLCQTW